MLCIQMFLDAIIHLCPVLHLPDCQYPCRVYTCLVLRYRKDNGIATLIFKYYDAHFKYVTYINHEQILLWYQ